MNSAGLSKRTFFGALVVMATLAVAACGSSSVASTGNNGNGNGNSNSSPSTGTGNGNGNTGGTLDPAVSVPGNFPGDFPVYSGARPTQQVVLSSSWNTSWEVTWETLDGLDKVQAFYTDKLKHGDWTITFEASTNGQYSATFARQSNSSFAGLMSVDTTSKEGVTTISVVLSTGS